MTEDQANLTRCCGPEGCGGNSSNGPDRYCLASHCMGWRWLDRQRGDGPVEQTIAADALGLPERSGFRWHVGTKATATEWHYGLFPRIGFCGLAGKP